MAQKKQVGAASTPERAKEIFKLAEAFRQAAVLLVPKVEGGVVTLPFPGSKIQDRRVEIPRAQWHITIPGTVVELFATELFFKCLLHVESGIAPATHDVLVLFNSLSLANQLQMKSHFRASVKANTPPPEISSRTIEQLLEESRDAFARWRYVYEFPKNVPGTKPLKASSDWVGMAVRGVLLKLKPEFGL